MKLLARILRAIADAFDPPQPDRFASVSGTVLQAHEIHDLPQPGAATDGRYLHRPERDLLRYVPGEDEAWIGHGRLSGGGFYL